MHDSYLWLTPLLTFLVVALVGFVGCDQLFGLVEVEDVPEAGNPVEILDPVPLDQRVDVRWNPYANASAYTVHWGTAPGDRPNSRTFTNPEMLVDGSLHAEINMLPNGIEHYFTVNATVGAKETPDSQEKSAVPGIYGVPTKLIFPPNNPPVLGTPVHLNGQMGMGIVIASKPIQVIQVGRAVVSSGSVHTVRIIEKSSGMQLAAGDVPTAGIASGQVKYADISPAVILKANATYYVLSDETLAGDMAYDAADTTVKTTGAASREFAAYGDFMGNYTEAPIDGHAYGPVDIVYVDLP